MYVHMPYENGTWTKCLKIVKSQNGTWTSILKIENLQVEFQRKTIRYKIKVGWSQGILEPLQRFHRNFENN